MKIIAAAVLGLGLAATAAQAQEAGPATAPAATAEYKKGQDVCAPDKADRDFVEPGEPLPGMGKVVFFRPSRFQGAALSFRVRAGELEYCTLGNGTYFVADLPPGAYQFDTRGEVKDFLPMEVEPGETYFVEGRLGMALVTMRPNLSPSTRAAFDESKKRLKQSKY